MLSRRELLSAGIAGGLTSEAGPPATEAQIEREYQREAVKHLLDIRGELSELNSSSLAVVTPAVSKIRGYMETFVRSHQKFPDFMEVGLNVFFAMYDWHIKNRQQLVVTRQPDGRYFMQFMFTSLILRPDQDANYFGIPYDRG